MTQWLPPRKLVYTWNVFSPGETESSHPESYLTLELEPRGEEVLLTLTHIPIPERFEKQTMMGWHTFLALLEIGAREEATVEREELSKKNAEIYGVDLENLAS